MSKNLSDLSARKGLTNNLFERLGDLAVKTGTPDKEDLARLADEFLMGNANTYGTATFYDFLKPGNAGKKVYVCNGSVCMMAGTQEKLTSELEKHVPAAEIGHMCCLGRCHENSAFNYNGQNYSARSADEIAAIFAEGKAAPSDGLQVYTHGKKLLTADFPGIEAYYQPFRDALNKHPEILLEEIKKSGVRGRGGAGFPMSMKLDFCRKEKEKQKFVVCNADEGDPGAFSDRYLLEYRPHAVLFGMMIAGYIIGADWGVVYIRGEYPESIEACKQAVKDLHEAGLLGQNIQGSGFNFNFKIIGAQGAYICGEETSLLSSIEGQRPEVRIRPPFPTTEGLFNKPTVVNNVETLAAIHFILENGGDAYASLGTAKSSGTKLVSMDSFFNKPGLYEVEMGTPLSTIVYELAGGFREPVKALHIGGPLGGLVPVSHIEKLNLSFESFQENGFLLGHASVICVPESFPIIRYMEHLMEFTAEESCGKCFPCRIGSVRGAEMFHKAQHEGYKIDRQLIDDLLHTMEVGSLCALGGGVPLPIQNALQHFHAELNEYFN
ncbi:MAG: NAD(P)H-dependent oxidoreductase subunit E [Bacteroidia bacterium]|nr:NAD(P)H-dependent oxidoreductase subunit E [Bacteroidia bacterium]